MMTTGQKGLLRLEDYNRLMQLIEPLRVKREMPLHVEHLLAQEMPIGEFNRGRQNIITMNAKMLLKNLSNGRGPNHPGLPQRGESFELQDFNIFGYRRIPFGQQRGEVVTWQTPWDRASFVWKRYCTSQRPPKNSSFRLDCKGVLG